MVGAEVVAFNICLPTGGCGLWQQRQSRNEEYCETPSDRATRHTFLPRTIPIRTSLNQIGTECTHFVRGFACQMEIKMSEQQFMAVDVFIDWKDEGVYAVSHTLGAPG